MSWAGSCILYRLKTIFCCFHQVLLDELISSLIFIVWKTDKYICLIIPLVFWLIKYIYCHTVYKRRCKGMAESTPIRHLFWVLCIAFLVRNSLFLSGLIKKAVGELHLFGSHLWVFIFWGSTYAFTALECHTKSCNNIFMRLVWMLTCVCACGVCVRCGQKEREMPCRLQFIRETFVRAVTR